MPSRCHHPCWRRRLDVAVPWPQRSQLRTLRSSPSRADCVACWRTRRLRCPPRPLQTSSASDAHHPPRASMASPVRMADATRAGSCPSPSRHPRRRRPRRHRPRRRPRRRPRHRQSHRACHHLGRLRSLSWRRARAPRLSTTRRRPTRICASIRCACMSAMACSRARGARPT